MCSQTNSLLLGCQQNLWNKMSAIRQCFEPGQEWKHISIQQLYYLNPSCPWEQECGWLQIHTFGLLYPLEITSERPVGPIRAYRKSKVRKSWISIPRVYTGVKLGPMAIEWGICNLCVHVVYWLRLSYLLDQPAHQNPSGSSKLIFYKHRVGRKDGSWSPEESASKSNDHLRSIKSVGQSQIRTTVHLRWS